MRKSIFEIVSENVNIENETERIIDMSKYEKTLCVQSNSYFTLFDYVDNYCFNEWEQRGHFVDVDDFLNALDFDDLEHRATYDEESLLTLIELVYNFWNLSEQDLENDDLGFKLQWCGNYYHLKNVMDDILNQYNHKVYADEDNNCIFVIEDKEEVTAVVEILPSVLATKVIKYNHRSLKGEIGLKKEILIALGAELEPLRKKLKELNGTMEDTIFFMLNSLNLRHNNCNVEDKAKYKKYVADMTDIELEEYYDELYQMILLAFLLLDNVDRSNKMKALKDNIVGTK